MAKELILQQLQYRKLLGWLNNQPNITAIKNSSYFRVRFHKTEITEYWALTDEAYARRHHFCFRMPSGPYHIKPLSVYRQFESDPFKPNQLNHHFIITSRQIGEAGWCDVRIKIHELADQIAAEDMLDFNYTDQLLKEDLEELKHTDINRHKSSLIRLIVFPQPNSHMGRRLRYHFLPWKKYLKGLMDRKISIYRALTRLVEKGRNLTRENLIREFEEYMPSIASPGLWRSVFQNYIDITNKKVYDIAPDWGAKLLAVSLEDGLYCHSSSEMHDKFAQLGNFLKRSVTLGIPCQPDIIILSSHRPLDLLTAISRAKICEHYRARKILIIQSKDLKEFKKYHMPTKIVRIDTQMTTNANKDDLLLIL